MTGFMKSISSKSHTKGGVNMRRTKGVLAMLCVTALLLVPALPALANGIFMPYFKGLEISPAEAGIGETVTISLKVGNDSIDTEGTLLMTLLIDGAIEAEQAMLIPPEERHDMTFTVSMDTAGTYAVNITSNYELGYDLSGTFTVGEGTPQPAAAEPVAAAEPAAAAEPVAAAQVSTLETDLSLAEARVATLGAQVSALEAAIASPSEEAGFDYFMILFVFGMLVTAGPVYYFVFRNGNGRK